MRDVARLPENDRRDLFRAAAQKMRVHEAIVEKDFWVCWALDYLFHDYSSKDRLVFKGGTSLSKAFGAIERFSEDIDLILDWKLLGYSEEEPWQERSATKQDAFGKESNRRTADFLAQDFVPTIYQGLSQRIGRTLEVEARDQDVLITYPAAFSLVAIQPQIRLEIGPMAAWVPNEQRTIRPYASDHYPDFFKQAGTSICTIVAERTFWEKATILHQEAHRGPDKPLPRHYSRHYYDLYRLSLLPICDNALKKIDLLQDVVQFKMRFYRCPWARYEDAKPGSLKLLPPEHHLAELKKDYQAMQAMLFGKIPGFDEIIVQIESLEQLVNAKRVHDTRVR
jgi:hypothetical protein